MAERSSSKSRRRASLTIGVGWALRGALQSEAGVDFVLASHAEPPPFFRDSLEQLRDLFDESGVSITEAESDSVLAGLLRAGLLAGRRLVALFSERGLRQAFDTLHEAARAPIAEGGGGVIVAVQSDWKRDRTPVSRSTRPGSRARTSRPFDLRELLACLDWPILTPSTPHELARSINDAMRISRASGSIVVVLVSPALAGSAETEAAGPESNPAFIAASHEFVNEPHTDAALLEARRRRIDQFLNPPAPGEQVPLGFIASGASVAALRQALFMLGLTGRLPILKLGLIHPVDPRSVERILTRCGRVVVVEAGGAFIERSVALILDQLRDSHEKIGDLRALGRSAVDALDTELHPSELVEAIAELVTATGAAGGGSITESLERWRALRESSETLRFQRPASAGKTRDITRVLTSLVINELREELLQPAADHPVLDLRIEAIDTAALEEREGKPTIIEIERRRLASVGRAAIAHAVRRRLPVTFLVLPDPPEVTGGLSTIEADRLVRSLVIHADALHLRIGTVDPTDAHQYRADLRRSILGRMVSVLIVDTDRFRRRQVESEGGPWGELGVTADELVARPASAQATALYEWLIRRGWLVTSLLDGHHGPKIELPSQEDPLTTPLDGWDGFEELQIRRTNQAAPVSEASADEIPDPAVRHAQSATWRVHLTGSVGGAFDDTVTLLEQAGRRMGYRVQSLEAGEGAERFRQIAFSRPREGEPALPITPRIAYGDADLVIALDLEALFDAFESTGGHRAASPQRSWLVLDLSPSLDASISAGHTPSRPTVPADLSRVAPPTQRVALRAAETADRLFNNRRLVGPILIGVAFQMGLIPVTNDALQRAAARSIDQAPDQTLQAIEIGRRIAETGVDPTWGVDDRLMRPEAMIRRHHRIMASRRWPRAERRAEEFQALALGALDAITGLRRSDPNRLAERRFVARLIDCERWGGLAMCEAYATRIRALYVAERSVTDYPITRLVIQELAHAMLIPDSIFVAATALRPDRRRADERRLRLNRAAGDRARSRLWTRTPARLRPLLGSSWRMGPGTSLAFASLGVLRRWPLWRRRERAYSAWVEQLVDRCCGELPSRASLWLEIVRQLSRVRGPGLRRRIMMSRVQAAVAALLELGSPEPEFDLPSSPAAPESNEAPSERSPDAPVDTVRPTG